MQTSSETRTNIAQTTLKCERNHNPSGRLTIVFLVDLPHGMTIFSKQIMVNIGNFIWLNPIYEEQHKLCTCKINYQTVYCHSYFGLSVWLRERLLKQ